MRSHWLAAPVLAVTLAGCGEDYAGFCEEVALQYNTSRYDRFEITDIIDSTTQDQPRPEVYVRFTGMRQSGATENRNVTCNFDLDSGKLAATEILVDGRKISADMLSQYNAAFAQ